MKCLNWGKKTKHFSIKFQSNDPVDYT